MPNFSIDLYERLNQDSTNSSKPSSSDSPFITEAFVCWIITDGYKVYRDYDKRQRCPAHLIRKAVALTGAVDEQAQKMEDWFLSELRGLIKEMAQGARLARNNAIPS
jgi:hypothetical protein